MTYLGLQKMQSKAEPHLGGNILEGDPKTFAPSVWNYVIDRFGLNSVLDLGSGSGYSANYFFNKGLKVIAVDGMAENIDTSIYPTIQVDITKEPVNCAVDLVHCQEVVEHIEEEFLENILQSLSCGKIILMTNALPGQKGFHHVNNQLTEYWTENLERYNCHLLIEDTNRIRKLAEADGAVYLSKTGAIYANRNKRSKT